MKYLAVAIACLLLFSCEKTITFDLENPEPKLVVDASIENGQAPFVILTRSLNYFDQITPTLLNESFVRNAEIYVSNGSVTHQLKEYSLSLPNGLTIYYYTNDPSTGTAFVGTLNTNYSLRIVAEGKEYTSQTTIPLITKQIDSLFWKPASGNNDSNKVVVMVRARDPQGFGDYVRYYTKRNSELFYPGFHSVYDDQVIDGTSYEVEVERGVDRNKDIPDDYNFFEKGDTVTLKLANIDKATFDFWRTIEFSYENIGNPFSSPTKVLGNVSGNALGYFGGYAAQFRTIIIPR